MQKTKIIYCSQCKNSRYVIDVTSLKKLLRCKKSKRAGVEKDQPTNSTEATYCRYFKPECKADVPLKTEKEWKKALALSGISTVNPYSYESDHPPN